MLKKIALTIALVFPLTALALQIQPADFYDDVRLSDPEAAGINLLTRIEAIEGYGNNMFGPTRLVNRAEFLKIAVLSLPEEKRPNTDVKEGCFPDVPLGAWFTPFICAAKTAGIVKGNPDGLFHPERTVQYDEALKMLSLLYGYEITPVDSPEWGEAFYKASASHGTDLPIRITFATPLTRALSARLAGAFLAEFSGQLVQFRLAEFGEYQSSSSSVSSSSSSIVSSSSSSSLSSSSSSSSLEALFTLPSVPHFLVTGESSDAIADGIVKSSGEPAKISLAEVKLFSEARSIERLEIVTLDGTVVATLNRKITTDTTDYKLTFQAQIAEENRYVIPADTDVPLVLRAVIRSADNAGFSEEFVHVRTFSVTLLGEKSNQSFNKPIAGPFPKHQTSFGRIQAVKLLSPPSSAFSSSGNVTLGSFEFSGSSITGKSLSLTALTFTLYKTSTVAVSNVVLVNPLSGQTAGCSVNTQAKTIFCPTLTGGVGAFAANTLTIKLQADVAVQAGSSNAALDVSLFNAGSPESLGAIEWTDYSGNFRWIEYEGSPVVRGIQFQ